MNCEEFRTLIVRQLTSNGGEAENLSAHLNGCESCRHYRTEMSATWLELDALAEAVPASSHTAEIMKRIAKPSSARGKVQAAPENPWRSQLLAAAVMVALAAGLFALVLRREPAVTKTSSPAGDGAEEKKKPEPPNPKGDDTNYGLTAAELESIGKLINDLDAEDFDTREAALKKLIALGPKIKPALEARFAHPEAKDTENLRHGIATAIAGFKKAEEQRAITETIGGIEAAIKEAPAHYIKPDPETIEKLKQKVTFSFADTKVDDAFNFISEKSGAAIVLDPKVTAAGVGGITLRVSDMAAGLALDWILKLAGLERVVRGKVVFITTPDSAAKLNLESRAYTLPVDAGDAPWTEAESKDVAKLLMAGPPLSINEYGNSVGFHVTRATVSLAGTIEVHTSGEDHEMIDKFMQSLKSAPRVKALPAWMDEIERGLQAKISVDFDQRTFADAINVLNGRVKINIIIDPKCAAVKLDQTKVSYKGEAPASEILSQLCKQANLAIEPRNQALFISNWPGLEATLNVVDARAALASGIQVGELKKKLYALQEPLIKLDWKAEEVKIVHGRWFAVLDAWTAQRAQALVDAAAKSGKLSELPPEPWFFKTLVLRPTPPPTPKVIPNTPDMDANPNGDDGK